MAAISTTDSTATVVKEMNDSDSAPFEVAKSLGFIPYPSQPKRTRFMAQLLFRVLAIAFTVASISVMVTSDQTILIFGITTQARYSYSSAFRFLVGAEAVVCGFSVLSLSLLCLMSRSEAILRKNFYLFLHDMLNQSWGNSRIKVAISLFGDDGGDGIGMCSSNGDRLRGSIRRKRDNVGGGMRLYRQILQPNIGVNCASLPCFLLLSCTHYTLCPSTYVY
ncbi:CASP-like protein 1F2 isoform X1 [Mercurialis annua]|uniref:CASP-like protein 1F2 isoform X1 n=1 Tax=Mercurialis annua TaxID=3986 RepID=UPI0021608194|nr:CASP-like protein 1F2 isoform X1 [Mercurialis annua]